MTTDLDAIVALLVSFGDLTEDQARQYAEALNAAGHLSSAPAPVLSASSWRGMKDPFVPEDRLASVQVGDKDPTSLQGGWCEHEWSIGEKKQWVLCTRTVDHVGQHIAGDRGVVLAVLPAGDQS